MLQHTSSFPSICHIGQVASSLQISFPLKHRVPAKVARKVCSRRLFSWSQIFIFNKCQLSGSVVSFQSFGGRLHSQCYHHVMHNSFSQQHKKGKRVCAALIEDPSLVRGISSGTPSLPAPPPSFPFRHHAGMVCEFQSAWPPWQQVNRYEPEEKNESREREHWVCKNKTKNAKREHYIIWNATE